MLEEAVNRLPDICWFCWSGITTTASRPRRFSFGELMKVKDWKWPRLEWDGLFGYIFSPCFFMTTFKSLVQFVHSRCALLLLVGKDAQAEPPRPAGCCKIGIIQPDQPGFLGCAKMFQLHSRVSVVQELLDRWRMPCPQWKHHVPLPRFSCFQQ
jgi:hypothetical protein